MSAKSNYIATALMFLIVLFLWRDQSRMKADALLLAEQNELLQKNMAAANTELESAESELDFFRTFHPAPSDDKSAKTSPATPEPVEEVETLILQAPTVSQTAEGLVARFEFQPTATELPENITLVVRVPGDSEAKILNLIPAGGSQDLDVVCIVNAQGTLGMIEGPSEELNNLAFELTVSEPVKAIVRGSKGIKAFELDITSSGCTVRKL